MWGAGWGYWGWGWWFWVFWAFILFLIIWGIGWGWNRGADDTAVGLDTESPHIDVEERILRRRYARGEITKEEFDQKVKDLRRAA